MSKTISTGFIEDTINGIKVNSSIKCNAGNFKNSAPRDIAYVVMHYTGNPKDKAEANAKYFTSSGRSASAHFFVDDTDIYQSVALQNIAWHCGAQTYFHKDCRNANSIGIEMCCTAGNYRISETTKKNAAYLCANICKRLGITAKSVDTYVLRHYDVTHKSCPAQMAKDNNPEWSAFKDMVKTILNGSAKLDKPKESKKPQEPKGLGQPSNHSVCEYKVKITKEIVKVKKGPGKDYEKATSVKLGEVYTIVEEIHNDSIVWGKLKSGAGYINLEHTRKV